MKDQLKEKYPELTTITDEEIIFTYDLGNQEDQCRFETSFDSIEEKDKVEAILTILPDEDVTLPEVEQWSVADILIENYSQYSIEEIDNFMKKIREI